MSFSPHSVAVLRCEADGFPESGQSRAARLELQFGDVSGEHGDAVDCFLVLDFDGARYSGGARYYGMDIESFVTALSQIYDLLEGSAILSDWDGRPALCVTALTAWRGSIAIGGSLPQAVFWTESLSEQHFTRDYGYSAAGIQLTFEGFVTDQSCLPEFISAIRTFLRDSGISTRNPMLG